ncbi:MAG: hypothetical protein V3V10_09330 [Planctomycetota bacterium]
MPIVSEPQIEPAPISALSHYDNAVWNCESCSIPINALDLIEGRASKAGGRLLCGRCGKSVSGRSESIQQSTEKAVEPEPVVAGRIPPKYLLRKSISNEASFTAKAEAESKRPMLPVVLFAIILPMFAISLYFAVMSQQKLNELRMENAAADRDDTKDDTVDRSRPAPEPLIPGRRTEQPEMPNVTPTSEPKLPQPNLPEPAPPTPINPISAETAKQLAEIEQDLARPVNALLESDNLADVWEGLSQAGSQRLIACRPWVRRLLLDQDDNTRALSAHVCGLLEDEDALTQLDRMSESDPSDHVRLQARKARSRLTGQATRELADFGTKELEKLLRELKEELSRRNRADD